MHTVDERISAVLRRSKRLRRRRSNHALIALICLMTLPLIDVAGRHAMSNLPMPVAPGIELLGASSMFGPSVGGYVLVALATAVIAVTVTALVVMRRRTKQEDEQDPEGKAAQRKTDFDGL